MVISWHVVSRVVELWTKLIMSDCPSIPGANVRVDSYVFEAWARFGQKCHGSASPSFFNCYEIAVECGRLLSDVLLS